MVRTDGVSQHPRGARRRRVPVRAVPERAHPVVAPGEQVGGRGYVRTAGRLLWHGGQSCPGARGAHRVRGVSGPEVVQDRGLGLSRRPFDNEEVEVGTDQ